MKEITIKLTVQQAVPVMMAINNQINNCRHMKMAFSGSGESKERVEILDGEIQSLAEAYKVMQEALG
ncbi:MAG: hypothetical protein HDT16_01525 [Oscillibacter sp.]|nr:hypothetical protein [Oscillibacter sp.]